jgi:hypothetical protein
MITEKTDSNDRKIRLLICKTCNVIVPLPDFEGPIDHDDTLLARVAEHQFPGSNRGHDLDLGRVSQISWDDPHKRDQILGEISKNVGTGKGEGLGQEAYDVKNTFAEDAMRCWRFKHGRTSNCADYMSDKMKILADTRQERKELGLDPNTRASHRLCHYCPMHSVVQSRKTMAKDS